MDPVDKSHHLKSLSFLQMTRANTQLLRRRFIYLASMIIVLCLFQTVGPATARITLPVVRSFSQLEGSGTQGESHGMTPEHAMELKHHDHLRSLRHRRVLTNVVDFPLFGDEYSVGLYYTEIGLGTPSEKYYVQVDTGSDLLWVNCKPCGNCPTSSDLGIDLRLYDPSISVTSRNTSCSSNTCKILTTFIADSPCVDSSCYYSFKYGDGSTAMGYLVEDTLTYDTVVANGSIENASARIVFGCGFNQSGDSLTSSFRAVNGIMGFGRQVLSVATQLADNGVTTNEFAHCLQGDSGQGGIFVIGDVREPGMVYTKMVANQYHYNVALLAIVVGATTLDIPSSTFNSGSFGDGGTIFDSGTTLAYLVDTAYDAFLTELLTQVTVPATTYPDTTCFEYSKGDLSDSFPSITLIFDGAEMELQPTAYLYERRASMSSSMWCTAWSRSSSSNLSLSILGDIVLKNKLVVYDMENEQIGWVDFDCNSKVQVSNGTANQVVDPNLVGKSSGSKHPLEVYIKVLLLLCAVVLVYVSL